LFWISILSFLLIFFWTSCGGFYCCNLIPHLFEIYTEAAVWMLYRSFSLVGYLVPICSYLAVHKERNYTTYRSFMYSSTWLFSDDRCRFGVAKQQDDREDVPRHFLLTNSFWTYQQCTSQEILDSLIGHTQLSLDTLSRVLVAIDILHACFLFCANEYSFRGGSVKIEEKPHHSFTLGLMTFRGWKQWGRKKAQ